MTLDPRHVPPPGFVDPPVEFTLFPFWFWNDRLDEAELLRQLDDFSRHGVRGFVIHPRVGLPRDQGWMSSPLLGLMRRVVDEAAARGVLVILYDEGMYPSGSASGRVVAENERFRCRGLAKQDLADDRSPELGPGWTLVADVRRANGQRMAVIDRPVDSVIRGLHFTDPDPPRQPGPDDPNNPGIPRPDPPEERPPAADLLNPEAVRSFIRHSYQAYYNALGDHFGKTILAVFTDEPGILGRLREPGVVAGTTGILEHVNAFLGYDFTPHLPALWYKDEPDAKRRRADWRRAINARLEQTYYAQLRDWCENHGVALTGHPAEPDDLGHERHLHIPGQDIVWRHVLPGASAVEGPQSTQAKCAASAMIHLGRRRNANEFAGAYGHQLTYDELLWLADWLLVRGTNLLLPHAFYYSVRGPRLDERPPDVGPHSPWWDRFHELADHCRRLCWVNTDSTHVCRTAVLGLNDHLPWRAARVLFEHQIDFNYLEARHLWEDARVEADGLRLADMCYATLVIDGIDVPARARPAIDALRRAGRVVEFSQPETMLTQMRRLVQPDAVVHPHQPDLRVRHVVKHGTHYYLFHNEGGRPIQCELRLPVAGPAAWLDTRTAEARAIGALPGHGPVALSLPGFGSSLLAV